MSEDGRAVEIERVNWNVCQIISVQNLELYYCKAARYCYYSGDSQFYQYFRDCQYYCIPLLSRFLSRPVVLAVSDVVVALQIS